MCVIRSVVWLMASMVSKKLHDTRFKVPQKTYIPFCTEYRFGSFGCQAQDKEVYM